MNWHRVRIILEHNSMHGVTLIFLAAIIALFVTYGIIAWLWSTHHAMWAMRILFGLAVFFFVVRPSYADTLALMGIAAVGCALFLLIWSAIYFGERAQARARSREMAARAEAGRRAFEEAMARFPAADLNVNLGGDFSSILNKLKSMDRP
jgi:hypothetical protein